jgi:starch-binding outer membrane protein, SusD/RagB family
MKTSSIYSVRVFGFLVTFAWFMISCDQFVEIDPPRTELTKETVFTSDATAEAAMVDIYYQMSSSGFASGSTSSLSFLGALSSDELLNYFQSDPVSAAEYAQFNENSLVANNTSVLALWRKMYQCIYKANAIVEGLSSSGVSENLSRQLMGEALFIRAFCHFYLVNLFGEVPFITTTDYVVNNSIPRMSTVEVYDGIINDLIAAQGYLLDDYSFSQDERVRVNKGAATALLARAYLYTEDWENAEIQATNIIDNSGTYSLVTDLKLVFSKNSTEAILQFSTADYPPDLFTFYIFSTPPGAGALREQFISEFEAADERSSLWVGSITDDTDTYYFPTKYSSFEPTAEYSTVLRLAEQHLIRAEARAQLSNIAGAAEDLNMIRERAGLEDTDAADKEALILAIEKERKYELFTEWGHRWLDLKRTNRADEILSLVKPAWKSTAQLYPIPELQILNDLAMKDDQNPGY